VVPRAEGGSDNPRNIVPLCEPHHDQLEGKNWLAINLAKSLYKKKKSSERGSLTPSESFPLDEVPDGWTPEWTVSGWQLWKKDDYGLHIREL
jgi:hypothetical protein